MSPSHNSSLTGLAIKDFTFGKTPATKSALRIPGHKAWQRIAWIGHPFPLRFSIKITKDAR